MCFLKTIGTVVATYNGQKYLREQIDSILSQSIRPHKIIVIDDHSTDDTTSILADYKESYPDIVVFEENEENRGYIRTFERGITICHTEYIAISDQDDIWEVEKIEKCYRLLEQNRDAKLCFHDLILIDERGNPLGKTYWESALMPLPASGSLARERLAHLVNGVPGCTMFFSADLKEHLLPMPNSRWSGHDWLIAVMGFFLSDPIVVREPLARYRIHPDQTCALAIDMKRKKRPRKLKELPFRIKREAKRIVFKRRLQRTKLEEARERDRALSEDVLRAIATYEALGLSHIPPQEIRQLKALVQATIQEMD